MTYPLPPPPPYNSTSSASSSRTLSPGYSSDPLEGEQRLEYRPRVGVEVMSTRRDGIFVHKLEHGTLVLDGQDKGASMPSYGRQSTVSGTLFLQNTELVSEVTIKV
jgi:hypothetical protein